MSIIEVFGFEVRLRLVAAFQSRCSTDSRFHFTGLDSQLQSAHGIAGKAIIIGQRGIHEKWTTKIPRKGIGVEGRPSERGRESVLGGERSKRCLRGASSGARPGLGWRFE